MIVKVSEFVWDHVGVRQEVKFLLAELVLHLYDVDSKLIFAGDLLRRREVIDLLILVQAFVKVSLTGAR